MTCSIRKAVQGDEQRICELFIEMLQTIYQTEDVQGYEPGYLERYWKNGEDIILVAADDDVIAYLAVEVHREDVDYIYLDDLSVTEKKRGNGIGTSLIHRPKTMQWSLDLRIFFFMWKRLILPHFVYTIGLDIRYTEMMETDT